MQNEDYKSCKNLCTNNFMYTKNFYSHKTAVANFSIIYLLKNTQKTCKPNNRDLNAIEWLDADKNNWKTIIKNIYGDLCSN